VRLEQLIHVLGGGQGWTGANIQILHINQKRDEEKIAGIYLIEESPDFHECQPSTMR
jgi:hypothetical protein